MQRRSAKKHPGVATSNSRQRRRSAGARDGTVSQPRHRRPDTHRHEPGPTRLAELFARSGIRLTPRQLDLFWGFHQLLRRRNAELDLTRLHSFDAMVLKLHVDSALVTTLTELPSPLLDLGSGAGFPGIPIKILCPKLKLVLAEPRAKRVQFLHEAIATLGLSDIEVVPHRIGRRFAPQVAGVITRALESIPETLERVLGSLGPGARVIFLKGPGCQDEIDEALERRGDDFELELDRAYAIPATEFERRLVILKKRGPERSSTPGFFSQSIHAVREVESSDSATFKELRALQSSRGIRKRGLALMAGPRHVAEMLRDFPRACVAWVSPDIAPPAGAPASLDWYRVSARLFREIDTTGTRAPLLLVQVPTMPAWSDNDWPPGCTLFVPFQDPENVGAVIRSAAAFGVARVVLLEEAAHPFHPRSVRAAAGTPLFRVPLLSGPAAAALEVTAAPLLALSPTGDDIGQFSFPPCFGLLPGLEGPGLPRVPHATHLRIPMQPGVESLNAATATAITLHVWRHS